MIKLKKVVVIVGPTASGKTALSLLLARKFKGEIISADSRQIYREMDIGTAKAMPDERNGVKHHLIDIREPDQDYSVGQFKGDAIRAIKQIIKKGKLPIMVGGTGLYVSALVDNLVIPPVKENKKLRTKIVSEIKRRGLDYVFDKLTRLDPEAAYIVDPKNPRRVTRALEVALTTGKPFTAQRRAGKPLFNFLQIGINQTPEALKKRISQRVHQMIKDGLVAETRDLVRKYGYGVKPLDAIGYREVIAHLRDKSTLDQAVELIIKNTWHYARRQMTWFRKNKTIKWLNGPGAAVRLVDGFLD